MQRIKQKSEPMQSNTGPNTRHVLMRSRGASTTTKSTPPSSESTMSKIENGYWHGEQSIQKQTGQGRHVVEGVSAVQREIIRLKISVSNTTGRGASATTVARACLNIT
jgi:hypothetical protein